jgi:hypothetical protein
MNSNEMHSLMDSGRKMCQERGLSLTFEPGIFKITTYWEYGIKHNGKLRQRAWTQAQPGREHGLRHNQAESIMGRRTQA